MSSDPDTYAAIGCFVIVLLIVGIIFWPWVVLWSINTLFGLAIPFTFWNWLAVTLLEITFGGGAAASNIANSQK